MTTIRPRTGSLTLTLVAATALLVGACGSSSKKSAATGATTGSTAASSASAAAGSPIAIGVMTSLSGVNAPNTLQAATVGAAWEQWVNKTQDGIGGHPVKVVIGDDASAPANAQAAEKKLVDQDNVVAIVSVSNLETAFDDDAIAKGVPIVAGATNGVDWYTKVGMFQTPTDVLSGLSAQVAVAKQFGKATKFADLYCSEVAACAQADPPLKAASSKAGIGFTSLAVSSTAPSDTAQCVQLQQQKVDYAQLNFNSSAASKFVQDCQTQGYNPTWGSSAQAIGSDLLGIKNFTAFGPAYAFPSVANGPPAQQFRDAMAKYAKDNNWHDGSASFTWDDLEMLRKAMASVGASPTRASLTAALYTVKDENLNGLLANKVTYTQGKQNPFGGLPCYFVIGIKDGKTIAPSQLNAQCPAAG
jgi:branched-chain amino acid transport system substrate-binding protein